MKKLFQISVCTFFLVQFNVFAFGNNGFGKNADAPKENTEQSLCSGTPDAGTISGPSLICNATSFTLIVTGTTNAQGITFQWEESSNGTSFTPISGATSSSLNTMLSGSEKYYRVTVACTYSGATATTPVFNVGLDPDECICTFCDSYATSAADTKIDTISFNGVTFGSAPNVPETQTAYCNPVLLWNPGETINVHLVNGSASGTHYTATARIFADWNDDGDFDDPDEIVITYPQTTGLNTIANTSFVVPPTAAAGPYLVRVVLKEGTAPNACGTYTYGETENFSAMQDLTCSEEITGTGALVLDSTRAAVYWDANPSAGFFKFQYRVKGTSAWTLVNVPNRDYQRVAWIISGLIKNTDYEYRVRQQCPDGSAGPYTSIDEFNTYTTSPCTFPDDSKIVYTANPSQVRLYIDYEPEGEKYDMRYRVQGTSQPIDNKIFKNGTVSINGLTPSTDYEYRLRTLCNGNWTGYSSWMPFTTNDVAPPAPALRDDSFGEMSNAQISIFPNPTQDLAYVGFENPAERYIRLVDLAGRILLDKKVQNELEAIDLSDYPKGNYFLQIVQENGQVRMEKLTKQ